jgi:hypothetical protein
MVGQNKLPKWAKPACQNHKWAFAMDEYDRHPGQPGYRNKRMHERDWATRQVAQYEWAKKRAGKSFAQIDKFEHGGIYDEMVQEFLEREGLLPASQSSRPKE